MDLAALPSQTNLPQPIGSTVCPLIGVAPNNACSQTGEGCRQRSGPPCVIFNEIRLTLPRRQQRTSDAGQALEHE
jgi:hypothetical protein